MPPEYAEGPSSSDAPGQASAREHQRGRSGLTRLDWKIVLVLFVAGASSVLTVTGIRGRSIADLSLGVPGRWFESDGTEILGIMSDRSSENHRIKLHPLFPLISYPATRAIMSVGKLQPLQAAFVLNALTAGAWLGTFYAINRLLDCPRLDSLIFTGLAATSGAALFWFIVPETYPLGSLTILSCFLVTALSRHRRVPDWCFVATSAASLSITVTNWMAGIAGTWVCRPMRRAIMLSAIAFLIVAGLTGVERFVFPGMTGFFFSPRGYLFHKVYVLPEEQGGPLTAARVVFLTSEVIPRLELSAYPQQQGPMGPMLTIQHSPAGSSGLLGQLATILWVALLAAGAVGLFAREGDRPFRIALGLTILGQSALYSVYGEETFLYALNSVPLFVLAVSVASRSRWRYAILALAALMLPCAAWNNASQLKHALDHLPQPRTGTATLGGTASTHATMNIQMRLTTPARILATVGL